MLSVYVITPLPPYATTPFSLMPLPPAAIRYASPPRHLRFAVAMSLPPLAVIDDFD